MNKKNKGRKLSLKIGPRTILLRVLANNFLVHEKITTTEAKAKELRSIVEKMITRAKDATLANRRILATDLTKENLKKIIENQKNKVKNVFVITDSVFSMDGDLALIREMLEIVSHYNGYVIVDEAHGVGVLGKTGMGLIEQLGLKADNLIETGTLSKAFGCVGGYVVGSNNLIDFLINKSRNFIYDTAIPVHIIEAARVALALIIEGKERQLLWENINYLQQKLNSNGFKIPKMSSAILPIIIGEEIKTLEISNALKAQNFHVPAIRYPTVSKGKSRLRLTITASHQKFEIDSLVERLKNAVI